MSERNFQNKQETIEIIQTIGNVMWINWETKEYKLFPNKVWEEMVRQARQKESLQNN